MWFSGNYICSCKEKTMKKQKIVCLWMLALALIFTLVFTACEHDGGIPGPGPSPGPGPDPAPSLAKTGWTSYHKDDGPMGTNYILYFGLDSDSSLEHRQLPYSMGKPNKGTYTQSGWTFTTTGIHVYFDIPGKQWAAGTSTDVGSINPNNTLLWRGMIFSPMPVEGR
jgi:hypothetical protein